MKFQKFTQTHVSAIFLSMRFQEYYFLKKFRCNPTLVDRKRNKQRQVGQKFQNDAIETSVFAVPSVKCVKSDVQWVDNKLLVQVVKHVSQQRCCRSFPVYKFSMRRESEDQDFQGFSTGFSSSYKENLVYLNSEESICSLKK